jgi:hypothetical protein
VKVSQRRGPVAFARHVQPPGASFATCGIDYFGNLLRRGFIQVGHDETCAFGSACDRGGFADTGSCAGDQRDRPVQTEGIRAWYWDWRSDGGGLIRLCLQIKAFAS